MRTKLLSLICTFLLSTTMAFATCETIVDGHCWDDFDVLEFNGISDPGDSTTGNARMYFDTSEGLLKCSEDGGAYTNCVGAGGGGSGATGNDTEIIFFDGTLLVGDSGLTYNKTTNAILMSGTTSTEGSVLTSPATRTITGEQTNIRPNSADFVATDANGSTKLQQAYDFVNAGSAVGATQGGGAGKGSIMMFEGTLRTSGSVNPYPGITLRGQGITSSVLKAGTGQDAPILCIDEDELPNAGYIFREMYFDGNQSDSTQTNTSLVNTTCGGGAMPGWDIQFIDTYAFDFEDTVIDLTSPWGFRHFNSHIEDSNGPAIIITAGTQKTTGSLIALDKIIQNEAGIKFDKGSQTAIQGNVVALSEINCDEADCSSIETVGGDFNLFMGISTLGQGALSGNTLGYRLDSDSDDNKIIGVSVAGIQGTAFVTESGATNNTIALSHCGNNAVGGTCMSDNGTSTLVFGVTDDASGNAWLTDKLPAAFQWNLPQRQINGQWYTEFGNLMAIVGASNHLRVGQADGSDYIEMNNEGRLIFEGTTVGHVVKNNQYVYKLQADLDVGQRYNSDRVEHEWLDTTGAQIAAIHATQGNIMFDGTMRGSGDVTFQENLTVSNDADFARAITVVDFTASTAMTIPNATDPTVDAEGELAWDTDDDALVIYQDTASTAISATYSISKTIIDPDSIQGTSAAVPLFSFTTGYAPHGITITNINTSINASASPIFYLQEYSDPTTFVENIEHIEFSSSTEVSDSDIDDAFVSTGSYVFMALTTTDTDWMSTEINYTINTGD